MMFSVHTSEYQGNKMLNICDDKLLGRYIGNEKDGPIMHISKGYYGGHMVSREEASKLLSESSIINMVGKDTISLAVELGIGSEKGARIISGVPFLLVFQM